MAGASLANRLLANRPLAALVGASALSSLGDWLYLTALPVLVFQRTNDPVMVGLVAAGRLVPFLLLSMPAGIIADRWPRRTILVTTELIRLAAMVAMAVLCAVGADVAWLVAMTLVAAAAGTISMPAFGGLVPELARSDAELGRANAIRATLDSIATIAGPALAGVLLVLGAAPIAFLLNGVSFGVVACALLAFRPRSNRERSSDATASATAASAARQPSWGTLVRRIAGPLALDAGISFGSAALGVLTVLIAAELLRVDASFTGVLNAGAGIGGVVGGLASAMLINRGMSRGTMVGMLAFAGPMLVLAAIPQPVVAIAALAMSMGGITMLDTINGTAVQRLTIDGGTGRAMGLINATAALWMMAGVAVPTALIATLGIVAALVTTAIVMALFGSVAALVLRQAARSTDSARVDRVDAGATPTPASAGAA